MSARNILVAAALLIAPLPSRAQGAQDVRATVLTNERAPDGWYAYGLALYKQENYRDAIGAFQRALQLGARNAEVSRQIARAYAQLGDERQAQRWTELAEIQYPFASPSPRGPALPLKRLAIPPASYSIEVIDDGVHPGTNPVGTPRAYYSSCSSHAGAPGTTPRFSISTMPASAATSMACARKSSRPMPR